MNIIRFQNRFRNWNERSQALTDVDCTDCPIQEPYPFDEANFSEKLNDAGVKYLVAHSIFCRDIVFILSRRPASIPDATIFREELQPLLCEDEVVETDNAGKGSMQMKNPRQFKKDSDRICKRSARARQENVFCAFKSFKILSTKFRLFRFPDPPISNTECKTPEYGSQK